MNKAVKTVSFIVAATFLSKVFGLLRDVFIGSFYGTGAEATAFLSASSIPVLFFDLTLGAAILSSFIPVFNGYLKKGDTKKAFEFSNSFINLVFLITFAFCIVGSIFSQTLVNVIAPGLDPEVKKLTGQLLIILLPTTVFTGLAYCVVGILQSFDEFNIPAVISLVSNVAVIAYLWLFNSKFGVYGLAAAMLFGWSLQLFIQLPSLKKKGYRYSFKIDIKNEGIREVVRISVPILIGSWVQPITVLINKNFASYMNGGSAVSALDYANRLFIIIVGVFAFAITNYIFPSVSRIDTETEGSEFVSVMKTSIRSIVLIVAPIFAGMMILSREIITIVYARGEFNELSVKLCSTALFYYSVGMISYGVNEIINKCFYAMKKAYAPMLASLCGIAVTVVLSLFLKNIGIGGLALSASLGLITVTVILSFMVNKIFSGFIDAPFLTSVFKTLLCTAVMAAAGIAVRHFTANLGSIVCTACTVIVCAPVYFVLQYISGNQELRSVMARREKE